MMDPHHFSEGVVHVLVNGTFAVRDGSPTSVLAGAPLRARVETQLGYKSMKFLRKIVVTDEFGEDQTIRAGWSWYAGI